MGRQSKRSGDVLPVPFTLPVPLYICLFLYCSPLPVDVLSHNYHVGCCRGRDAVGVQYGAGDRTARGEVLRWSAASDKDD